MNDDARIYHVNYEIDYEGVTTVLITDDYTKAKAAFAELFVDPRIADRRCLDTWLNGKVIETIDFQLDE